MNQAHRFRTTPLPFRMAPSPGESFTSYVDRLSDALKAPLITVLHRTGVVEAEQVKSLPPGYGIFLNDVAIREFSHATNLPEPTVRQMLLMSYSGIAFPEPDLRDGDREELRKLATRTWAYFSGSHVCPACLAETGGAWQTRWKFPWSFACVQHAVMLADTCNGCGRRTGELRTDRSTAPRFASLIPVAGACQNSVTGPEALLGRAARPCGFPLDELKVVTLAGHERLVATQVHIDMALAGMPVSVAGSLVSPLEFFENLHTVCAMILYGARPSDVGILPGAALDAFSDYVDDRDERIARRRAMNRGRRGPMTRVYVGPPQSAALMAAILPSVVELLGQPTPRDFAVRMTWLIDRLWERRGRSTRSLVRYFNASPIVEYAFDFALSDTAPASHEIGLKSPEYKLSGSPAYRFTPDHVPQMLDLEEFSQLIPILEGLDVSPQYARMAASVALVQLTGEMPYLSATQALGLPPSIGPGTMNKQIGFLKREGLTGAYQRAIHGIARSYSDRLEKINYGHRRRALASFKVIPMEQWIRLCHETGIPKGKAGGKQRFAAAWVWCLLTGGYPPFSPALDIEIGNRDIQPELYARFCKEQLPPLESALYQWSLALAARIDSESI